MTGNDELAGQDITDRTPGRAAAHAREEEEQARAARRTEEELEVQAQENLEAEQRLFAEQERLAALSKGAPEASAAVRPGQTHRNGREVADAGEAGLQDVLDRAVEVERASTAYADAQDTDAATAEEAHRAYQAAVQAHEQALEREQRRAAMRGLFDQQTAFALAQQAAVAEAEQAWGRLGDAEVARVTTLMKLRAARVDGRGSEAWSVEDAQAEAVRDYHRAESRAVQLGISVAELPRAKAMAGIEEVREPVRQAQPEPRRWEPEPVSVPSAHVEPVAAPVETERPEPAEKAQPQQPEKQVEKAQPQKPEREATKEPRQERPEASPQDRAVAIAPPSEREARRAAKRHQRQLNKALARGKSIDGLVEGGPMQKTRETVTMKPGGLFTKPRPIRKDIVRTNGRFTELQTWEKPGRFGEWKMTRRSLTENDRGRSAGGRWQPRTPARTAEAPNKGAAKAERPVQQAPASTQQTLAREAAYQAQLARERAEQAREERGRSSAEPKPMTSVQRAALRRARDAARAKEGGGLSR